MNAWNDMAAVRASNWLASRPTRVIIHGQLANAQSDVNIVLTAAYLANGDVNVVVVDWSAGADTVNYVAARNQVANVGSVVAGFLDNLHEAGRTAILKSNLLLLVNNEHCHPGLMDFGRLTIAAHSLGGHVGGFVGKRVTRGRIHTIVG